MTTERRGLFVLKTSEDGTKCAAECPQFVAPSGKWRAQCRTPDGYQGMGAYGGEDADVDRLPWCVASESAACEAEVDALRRGFAIAKFRAEVDDVDGNLDWGPARGALEAEIERIRGGR